MGFETCGPNEVLVVSGFCLHRPKYVLSGWIFVWPGFQKLQRLSLNTITLTIESANVCTQRGVAVTVTSIAQVKFEGGNTEVLGAACEHFLGKSESQIRNVAQETLEGHQRTVIGNMTVEEIYEDREKFSKAVFEVASCDLICMGFYIVSYKLEDIRDDKVFPLGPVSNAIFKLRSPQTHGILEHFRTLYHNERFVERSPHA